MVFERKAYLKQLVDGSKNDMVKIVTGIHRCGKSYLLFNLFRTYLLENGLDEQHIIALSLDDRKNRNLCPSHLTGIRYSIVRRANSVANEKLQCQKGHIAELCEEKVDFLTYINEGVFLGGSGVLNQVGLGVYSSWVLIPRTL